MEALNMLVTVLVTLIPLIPVIVKIITALTALTHNKRLKNLSLRAEVVVTALEKSNLTNDQKKQAAMDNLATYANEVGIKVTSHQLSEYIESALFFVQALNTKQSIQVKTKEK